MFEEGTLVFVFAVFFFNDTATTEIYTLSLHDALPISHELGHCIAAECRSVQPRTVSISGDRKSTRLNSSHSQISYAVFCLKKKNIHSTPPLSVVSHHNRTPSDATQSYRREQSVL